MRNEYKKNCNSPQAFQLNIKFLFIFYLLHTYTFVPFIFLNLFQSGRNGFKTG